ncbi:MAG: hypothetical protein ABIH83_06225 [Candidatus Micrarchaeota archaeon]
MKDRLDITILASAFTVSTMVLPACALTNKNTQPDSTGAKTSQNYNIPVNYPIPNPPYTEFKTYENKNVNILLGKSTDDVFNTLGDILNSDNASLKDILRNPTTVYGVLTPGFLFANQSVVVPVPNNYVKKLAFYIGGGISLSQYLKWQAQAYRDTIQIGSNEQEIKTLRMYEPTEAYNVVRYNFRIGASSELFDLRLDFSDISGLKDEDRQLVGGVKVSNVELLFKTDWFITPTFLRYSDGKFSGGVHLGIPECGAEAWLIGSNYKVGVSADLLNLPLLMLNLPQFDRASINAYIMLGPMDSGLSPYDVFSAGNGGVRSKLDISAGLGISWYVVKATEKGMGLAFTLMLTYDKNSPEIRRFIEKTPDIYTPQTGQKIDKWNGFLNIHLVLPSGIFGSK